MELLLLCARVEVGAGAAARIGELLEGGVEWPLFLSLASRHGVWGLVHRTLADIGRGRVPEDVLVQLRRGAHAMAALVQVRIDELLALLGAFEASGIQAISFKGVALGAYAYGSPFRRKPGDYDLLVRREHFERVREILIEQGYRPRVPPAHEARYLRTRAGSTFEHPDGNVDLHWTLEQKAFDSLPFSVKLDASGVWERSVSVELGGTAVRTLSPEDYLFYLCAHGARHAWAAFYSVCDVAEVIRTAPEMDWERLYQDVRSHRTERILHLGLLLAHSLLDAALPEEVRSRALGDGRAVALAFQVAGWIFDPESTAGERWKSFPDTVRSYRYRVNLLERPTEKAGYLAYRAMRKLSKMPGKLAGGSPYHDEDD